MIGVPNWESAAATAYILREMLTRRFDIPVQLQPGTNEEIYTGIAAGTIHVHPEGWTPNHNDWHNRFAGSLSRNHVSSEGIQGLCVDRALSEQYGIERIEDLLNTENTVHFDRDGDGRGELWIGAEGWGSTTIERIRAKSYGYDASFELLKMEEEDALRQFGESTVEGKLFGIYCYTPHWMWRTYDLYRLKEPEYDPDKWTVMFPSEDPEWLERSDIAVAWKPALLHIYFAPSLEQEYPAVAQFLREIHFTVDQLTSVAYEFKATHQSPELYAKEWVDREYGE